MAISHKELALAVIKFLESSVADKTVSEEFAESLDVAVDCIADAFEVEKAEAASISSKFGGKSLLEAVNSASTPAPKAASAPTQNAEISAETKAKADALKKEGNSAMAEKNFAGAVAKYTEAIALDATNVVYLSNRAAAHSSLLQHEQAVADAKAAIELEPSYTKAYSRLGLAQYALGHAQEAMDAYKKGMEIEGAAPSDAMKRGYETAKKRVEEELESSISKSESATRNASEGARSTASAGAGAGAGAGGMPDLASMFGGGMPNFADMMNNPQLMQAAQNLMSNTGAMEGLMNNPMLRQMAQGMGGEGGLEGLMSNPALQNMARQFMGGSQGNADGSNAEN